MSKEVWNEEVIICNIARRGEGVEGDPIRIITQVFTKDGELIAEKDPCADYKYRSLLNKEFASLGHFQKALKDILESSY